MAEMLILKGRSIGKTKVADTVRALIGLDVAQLRGAFLIADIGCSLTLPSDINALKNAKILEEDGTMAADVRAIVGTIVVHNAEDMSQGLQVTPDLIPGF
jgi:hypothetical protein